jgi:uncharacterized protein (DUF427 family)
MVEGNHYFPLASIKREYFTKTDHTSYCPWKGTANYFSITVEGKTNENGAWFYDEPKEKANNIKDHVAFWNGVQVTE